MGDISSSLEKGRYAMTRLEIPSAKLNVVFPKGKLPTIDPSNPAFVLVLGSTTMSGKVNAKATRKLAQHEGGAVLQARLIVDGAKLVRADAGFSWIEPKNPAAAPASASAENPEDG
jgi:hypothetical protein